MLGSVEIQPNGWYVEEKSPEDFRFRCGGSKGPIVWKQNGKDLGQTCVINEDRHICNSSLYISNFRLEFAGQYTCEDTLTKESDTITVGGNHSLCKLHIMSIVLDEY
jgi:hypothetical protein